MRQEMKYIMRELSNHQGRESAYSPCLEEFVMDLEGSE
jgi:hypothetical protein